MMISPASIRRIAADPEMLSRILATILALLAYRIATYCPLPGISLLDLSQIGGRVPERLSVVALGVIPWLSATTLAEIAVLVLPGWVTRAVRRGGHADPFTPIVVAGALALAALQANGIAVALKAMPNIVQDGGAAFRLGVIGSLVGGSALTILLAALISRLGIGSGFWVLLASFAIWTLTGEVVQTEAAWLQGIISGAALMQYAGLTAASIGAVVALVVARQHQAEQRHEALVWPIFLYAAVAPWFAVLAQIVGGSLFSSHPWHQLILPHKPIGALLVLLFMAAICLRYGRRAGRIGLASIEALVLSALLVTTVGAPHWFGFGLPSAGPLVILATVATLLIQSATQTRQAEMKTLHE